ncbi:MAG TPA: cytochrome c oxidase subunit 3 [Bryobacteraceae bacterium]|nr:cytochrome c oxidase subunit 3 [Bryobacteraceae bacterium]
MTTQRVLDVSSLPDFEVSSRAPLWWGQLFLVFIEGTMFSILIAMYFYIRLSMDMWPPPGIQLPHEVLPAISLALLILSCAGSYWSSEAAKKDERRGMILGLALNIALAFGALACRAVAWHDWNFKWTTSAYGSITWAILFVHTLDVGADLAFTVVLLAIIAFGPYGPKQRLGVHVDSLVWYFLVAIWIPLYVAVYWGPYIVGAP